MIRVTFSPPRLKKRISRNTEEMWEEHALRRGDPGVSDSQLPALGDQDWNSLRLVFVFSFFFLFFVSHCRREKEGRGERRRPQVTFWIISSMPGANEWERKREGGRGEGGGEERWGRVEVKGKGVKGKTAATCSFPLRSAWWLQALDFHRGLTLLHIVLSLQSVWKLRPQREDSLERLSVNTLLQETQNPEWMRIRHRLLNNEQHQFTKGGTGSSSYVHKKKEVSDCWFCNLT